MAGRFRLVGRLAPTEERPSFEEAPETMTTQDARASCRDVTAVIVSFHPDLDDLRSLLLEMLAQVGRVVLVDNASFAPVESCLPEDPALRSRIDLLRNEENLGIAAAQNQGIARALESSECRYVLLSDQDSLPAPYMAERLRQAFSGVSQPGPVPGLPPGTGMQRPALPIAAVGPRSIDMRTGDRSVLIIDNGVWPERLLLPRRERRKWERASTPLEVSFLLASGSMIPAEVFRSLRGMRGNYFIDHVDTEWCLRARSAGYRLLVVPDAFLYHRLGDRVRRLWLFGVRQVSYHTPLRDYYMFRNTLLMMRDLPLNRVWRVHFLARLVMFAGYFLTLGDRRLERLRHMWMGIRHGLRGISGRLEGRQGCVRLPRMKLDPSTG
jgi:rhamnosyltransferase